MSHRLRRWLIGLAVFTALLLGAVAVAAEYYVEPALRKRIGIIIVQGSDSLYRYSVGKINASLFGGSVEIDSLAMWVDSTRYRQMQEEKRLPSLTMRIELPHGHIRGLNIWSMLLGRQVKVGELFSEDARIELWRNSRLERRNEPPLPLWKAIRPGLSGITLDQLRLDRIRFAYRYATDSANMQLKFDTCTALIRDIRIDSASAADPERIGFCKYVNLHFYDLKFRSTDSSIKLKAKVIDYASDKRLLTIREFKLQPTLKDKESFYGATDLQRQMSVIEFGQLDLHAFRLESFITNNKIEADSLVVRGPKIDLYTDKTLPPTLEGKTGSYPHQRLLAAGYDIDIRKLVFHDLDLQYTERSELTAREGTLRLHHVNLVASNVTNIPELIRKDTLCRVEASGAILGGSQIHTNFRLNLTDTEGRFSVDGSIRNVRAAQLNGLAEPLANVRVSSLSLHELRFALTGDEYTATGDVWMRYNGLEVELMKEDPETGLLKSKKFLNKIISKFTIRHSNPEGGGEMMAPNVQRSRLMTQTFFGLIWKTVFSGVQTIMTNTGEVR